MASRPECLICPLCEANKLCASAQDSMRCQSCSRTLSEAVLNALRQIIALPDTLGSHACECGHPEMRLLPDAIFHCPACGSEVLPLDATSTPSNSTEHSEAYSAGWMDGRFEECGSFVDNPTLARWESPSERLDYYRGHRKGSESRRISSNSSNSDARERLFG